MKLEPSVAGRISRMRMWPLPLHAIGAVMTVLAAVAIAIDAWPQMTPPEPKLVPRPQAHAAAKNLAPKRAPTTLAAKAAKPSVFEKEQAMNYGQLMRRWNP